MKLVDMHCDTLFECYVKKLGLVDNSCQVNLKSMKEKGALAQFFAIFLPSGNDAVEEGISIDPYELFQEIYKLYIAEIKRNSNMIEKATSYQDIKFNALESKMSAILTIEDGALLEGDIKRLDEMYDKGVRLITLLWNKENCIGFPHSENISINKRGLKDFGIEVVERMNELGMIVDVSHLSEGGFYDVVKYSKKPFVASHSCAMGLCKNSRNLTDHQLKCIADSGGVVGVNYNASFLKENSSYSTVADIMAHIDYIMSVAGDDVVALGSDFDGINCDLEISGYREYDKLVNALMEKYPDEIVEKICYKNICRVIKECL